MDRLAYDSRDPSELELDDILRRRTELLVLMATDIMKGKSLGHRRHSAIEKNADWVERGCIGMISTIEKDPIDDRTCLNMRFFYYLKGLAGLMKSSGQVCEKDAAYRQILREHVEIINEMLEDDRQNDPFVENCLSLMLLKLVAVI